MNAGKIIYVVMRQSRGADYPDYPHSMWTTAERAQRAADTQTEFGHPSYVEDWELNDE